CDSHSDNPAGEYSPGNHDHDLLRDPLSPAALPQRLSALSQKLICAPTVAMRGARMLVGRSQFGPYAVLIASTVAELNRLKMESCGRIVVREIRKLRPTLRSIWWSRSSTIANGLISCTFAVRAPPARSRTSDGAIAAFGAAH